MQSGGVSNARSCRAAPGVHQRVNPGPRHWGPSSILGRDRGGSSGGSAGWDTVGDVVAAPTLRQHRCALLRPDEEVNKSCS